MADSAASAPVATSPKKSGKPAPAGKKPAAKPSHPKTSDMVISAVKNLKDRGGSSLQAIKKYIASNYKVDAEKLAPYIRKHLIAAVGSGVLVQTKGKGASGSFKLAKKESDKPKVVKKAPPKDKKPKAAAKPKKPAAAKKASSPAKKAVAAKKKPASEGAAKKPKSPAKAKKVKAAAAKKPKPKKVAAKKSSPKKAAPKKK